MNAPTVESDSPVTEPGVAVATQSPRALRILRPVQAPAQMIEAQNDMRAFIEQVLEKDKDYGVIPGVKKPSLLKPGAEKVTLGFGCVAVPRILEREVEHDRPVHWVKQKKVWNNAHRGDKTFRWEQEEGDSLGLYRYVVAVDIVDPDGVVRGTGIGACSSMESKYVDRPRDSENTILKMATKRAHVGAVLGAFGLSEQFTQDVEDLPREAIVKEAPPESPLDKKWPNWPNFAYARKPFRDIPTDVLTEQLQKARTTVEKARERRDADVVRMGEALIANIEAVLEIRRTDAPAPEAAEDAELPF
ncbi:MAG: hypothetical protein A3E78_04010 [Alphaproteobacteria bacterium RIFCSPHIGHO2_12_FULL_63_12]|nr:MAG: hypothetical protein A3E78_04010 [Alphaproteobacteria bacterium RIFCSPHIGHO2_12_FULL_63_12]